MTDERIRSIDSDGKLVLHPASCLLPPASCPSAPNCRTGIPACPYDRDRQECLSYIHEGSVLRQRISRAAPRGRHHHFCNDDARAGEDLRRHHQSRAVNSCRCPTQYLVACAVVAVSNERDLCGYVLRLYCDGELYCRYLRTLFDLAPTLLLARGIRVIGRWWNIAQQDSQIRLPTTATAFSTIQFSRSLAIAFPAATRWRQRFFIA